MKKYIIYTMFERLVSHSSNYENALVSLGLIDEIVVKVVEEEMTNDY